MREIKFRGKRIDTGEWVEGFYYVEESKRHMILPIGGFPIRVDPLTVGQFTGLKDKNGKEIFEGDHIDCFFSGEKFPFASGTVVFFEGMFNVLNNIDNTEYYIHPSNNIEIKIIGTIHDLTPTPNKT